MPEQILYPDFRAELEATKYPFADTVSLLDTTKAMRIEPDSFLDASLYLIGASDRLYLSQITVDDTANVLFVISDEFGTATASAPYTAGATTDVLVFNDPDGRPAGIIISEALRLLRFTTWPAGTYTFKLSATEFVASCVIPTPGIGVRSLRTDEGFAVSGEVWLVGDDGVVITSPSEAVIRIDVVGEPLFKRKRCTDTDEFVPPNFIRTINNCPPDAYGNYHILVGDQLAGDTILRIYPTDAGVLRIEAVGQILHGD
jgi:hypothetical protein